MVNHGREAERIHNWPAGNAEITTSKVPESPRLVRSKKLGCKEQEMICGDLGVRTNRCCDKQDREADWSGGLGDSNVTTRSSSVATDDVSHEESIEVRQMDCDKPGSEAKSDHLGHAECVSGGTFSPCPAVIFAYRE